MRFWLTGSNMILHQQAKEDSIFKFGFVIVHLYLYYYVQGSRIPLVQVPNLFLLLLLSRGEFGEGGRGAAVSLQKLHGSVIFL